MKPVRHKRRPPVRRFTQPFLSIDLAWLRLTFAIRRTRALRVGLYVWHLAGLAHRRVGLLVSASAVAWEFGGGTTDALRGLRDLETRGLLTVRWRPRHASVVTLPSDATIARLLEIQADRAEASQTSDPAPVTLHRRSAVHPHPSPKERSS